ncbi:TVP38/TMEM64 family protein [Brevibacillus ginsengisoli]|uniref:TVP38/TMEM64 family protein n=1 Tax=Brevibacillus ginsengisoli TaxID=363854 RepID=UPI003CEDCBEE
MKKVAVILVAVIGVILLLTQTKLGALLQTRDIHLIAAYIKSFGILSVLISGVLTALQTYFPFVPFFILAGVNVIVFGPVGGFILSFLAAVIGACTNFLVARYLAHEWAQAKVGNLPFFKKLNDQAEKSGFRIILMARLIPVLPSGAINLASGLSAVSFAQFALATLIGNFPMTFLEAILGHDIFNFHEHKVRFFVVVSLLGLLMWGGSKLGKIYENRAESTKGSRIGKDDSDAVGEGRAE